MSSLRRTFGRALAVAFSAVPFAFGVIRAVQTGTDVRYLWVALAAMVGGIIATAGARGLRRSPNAATLAAAVFVMSTVLGVVAALLLGTRLGPGILVVAAGFGGCFAASSLARLLAGRD